jgi:type VI secretion system protein VasD
MHLILNNPVIRYAAAAGLAAGLSALIGCGAIGGISRDTSEKLVVPDAIVEIVAAAGLNPDNRGVAKPVQLRLYELRSKSSFERVGFLEMQDKDDVALGLDFVRRDELLIFPGERRKVTIKGNPDVKVFGVLAAYRDLDKSTWRAMTSAPNSLELRKSWWGFGSIQKPSPIEYTLKLTPTRVHLELKQQGK